MVQQETQRSCLESIITPPLPDYLEIIRRPEVSRTTARSVSSLYLDNQNGLMPPPISLGDRAVGFYKHEVQAVIAAMGAGHSKEQIKALINKLVEQRQKLAKVAFHE